MTEQERIESKVPAVTLGFWIVKILATTLGETDGDTVAPFPRRSHRARRLAADTGGLGYGGGALLFGAALAVVAVCGSGPA